MSRESPAQAIRDLVRLSPNRRNPQRFFEDRSEIEHQLRLLARDPDNTDA